MYKRQALGTVATYLVTRSIMLDALGGARIVTTSINEAASMGTSGASAASAARFAAICTLSLIHISAAGLVQMHGGTPEQGLDAASITISNMLGLVCDPVGGLVEVPCQARNAQGCLLYTSRCV